MQMVFLLPTHPWSAESTLALHINMGQRGTTDDTKVHAQAPSSQHSLQDVQQGLLWLPSLLVKVLNFCLVTRTCCKLADADI